MIRKKSGPGLSNARKCADANKINSMKPPLIEV